jgi:hypothetical protein
MSAVRGIVVLLAAAGLPAWAAGAEPPRAPVPPSPFLPVVYRYADAMLEKAGAGGPAGAPAGASFRHDQNLLRLLQTLSELSAKPLYREAADLALRSSLENAAPDAPGPIPWDEPWLLWDRCFDLAPAASARLASGRAPDGVDSPRQAGFHIRARAVAYARTRDDRFLEAIETLLDRFERRRHPATGLIPARSGGAEAWPASTLSLSIDCDGAAHRVPEPLASRLRAFAAREDDVFSALPHDIERTGGFITVVDAATGKPGDGPTPLWEARQGGTTTAQVAMLCVSRHQNTGDTRHRDLVRAAARAYLGAAPPAGADLWPGTFGQAISLELAAWRSTADARHLDGARELGNRALEGFFGGSPLPRASLKSEHHESITGADTLALALVELHLHILYITAVRCPPNTADR